MNISPSLFYKLQELYFKILAENYQYTTYAKKTRNKKLSKLISLCSFIKIYSGVLCKICNLYDILPIHPKGLDLRQEYKSISNKIWKAAFSGICNHN